MSDLSNKYITVNGDSVCNGAGCGGGYVKIIAERCGMKYQNVAVNGASITAETYRKSGAARLLGPRIRLTQIRQADFRIQILKPLQIRHQLFCCRRHITLIMLHYEFKKLSIKKGEKRYHGRLRRWLQTFLPFLYIYLL